MRWDREWFSKLGTELALLPHLPLPHQRARRRALARDPIAFAVTYLRRHLRDRAGRVTFSEIHFEWASIAEGWARPARQIGENRHAVISPRECGKTTWWYLLLPLWAAVNGYVRFAVAFAKDESLAHGHLQTLKHELDTNVLLRADFPELCTPARKQTGTTVADRQGMLHTQAGFVFAAKGIDGSNLGLKVGAQRPDLIILDDIEPDEAKYSPALAEKRLGTLLDAIIPLNQYAPLVLSGTVTMVDSLIHQCVKAAQGIETADWINDQHIQCHWYNAIQTDDDGTERSVWPEKWPIADLQAMRHTRSYAKNYLNDPMGRDGDYWTSDDFIRGNLDGVTKVALFLDPAITARKTSDFTGVAVVGWAPHTRQCIVLHARGVKHVGARLRDHVVQLLVQYPSIGLISVEANQAGDLWYEVLHNLPVKVITHWADRAKEYRFSDALVHYQARRVVHADGLRALEEQMVSFPKAPYDDIADAVVAGVNFFLTSEPVKRVRIKSI